jgi:class 3 adenylate cyclase
MEVEAARAAFERLGAAPDERRAATLLASIEGRTDGAAPRPVAGERVARAFVFTDIVDSTRLAELLGDEAWNAMLRWHDQALRSLIAEQGGEEIKRTGDGFFLAFATPDAAIECGVAIQRRLSEQQQTQGFAPAVRIGAHWAEATRSGLDYIGGGVNQAARIGAMAGAAEILVSASMLATARRAYAELDRRTVSLKGIAQPIEVVSLGWR